MKKAAAAPDRQKLIAFAAAILAMRPTLSAGALSVQVEVETQTAKLAAWVEKRAEEL